MRNFAFRLLCAPGALMMAQTATVHATTSFGTGVVLPSFLPPAPPALPAGGGAGALTVVSSGEAFSTSAKQ